MRVDAALVLSVCLVFCGCLAAPTERLPPGEVYSIGDSITAGHPYHSTSEDSPGDVFDAGENLNYTYQYWLDYYYGSNASFENSSVSFYNKGYGGHTCADVLERFERVIPPNETVVLMCGINDFSKGHPLESVEANITLICDSAFARGNRVILLEVLPYGNGGFCGNISALNSWLSEFSRSRGLTLVSVNREFTNGTPCYPNQLLFVDSVHPNAEGQRILGFELWRQAFNKNPFDLRAYFG